MIAIANTLERFFGMLAAELLTLSWQGTLLILLVLAVTLLWRRGPACFKYGLWCLVLVKLVMPIHLSSPTGVINLLPEQSAPLLSVRPHPAPASLPETASVSASEPIPHRRTLNRWNWRSGTGLIWSAGAILCLLLGMIRYIRMKRLLLRSSSEPSKHLMAETNALQKMLRLKRRVSMVESDAIDSPLLMGILRPVIVLPRDFLASLTRGERLAILVHELMHVIRLDHLVIGLELLVRSVHWFNPLVRLAIAKLRTERERACDDRVVAFLDQETHDYSNSLLKIVNYRNEAARRIYGALTLSEKKSETGHRIKRILTPSRRIVPRLSYLALLALGIVALVVLPNKATPYLQEYRAYVEEEDKDDTKQFKSILLPQAERHFKKLFGSEEQSQQHTQRSRFTASGDPMLERYIQNALRTNPTVAPPKSGTEYTMPIIKPDPGIHYTMRQAKPDPTVNHTIRFVNPIADPNAMVINPEIPKTLVEPPDPFKQDIEDNLDIP